MFLDDELNQIYEENGCNKDSSMKLLQACFNRLEDPNNGVKAFLNSVKRIDASWRLSCSKHKEYNKDGFRLCFLENAEVENDNLVERLKKDLNW